MKTLKVLFFVFLLLATILEIAYCQTSPRSKIGATTLRDSIIGAKKYFDITNDSMTIFRNNVAFNQRLFPQNIYFDTISPGTRMNTDTIFQGSHSLILKFDNGSRIVWDSLGNTYYWSSGNANNWYLLNTGAIFSAGGLTQNGHFSFHNYLYKTNMQGGNTRPDSSKSGVFPWRTQPVTGTAVANAFWPRTGDVYFYKAGQGFYRPTSYITTTNANRTMWIKEDSATYSRDSLSGWYSVKTNSYTTLNLTGSSASLPMLHSVINLRFNGGSGGYTIDADTLQANRGVAGNQITLIITDTTASDRVITFSGFLSSSGTITTTGNNTTIHTITFACLDGRRWYEVSRTLNLTRIN